MGHLHSLQGLVPHNIRQLLMALLLSHPDSSQCENSTLHSQFSLSDNFLIVSIYRKNHHGAKAGRTSAKIPYHSCALMSGSATLKKLQKTNIITAYLSSLSHLFSCSHFLTSSQEFSVRYRGDNKLYRMKEIRGSTRQSPWFDYDLAEVKQGTRFFKQFLEYFCLCSNPYR